MTAPTQRKYGKRPPKRAAAINFAELAGPLSTSTYPPVDYLSQVNFAGSMNGNDAWGDCVACMIINITHVASVILTGTAIVGTKDEALAIYKTQNPDFDPNGSADANGPGSQADGGMDEQTALEYWQKTGFTIGGQLVKLAGFAAVNHSDLASIKAAISVGGVLGFGVTVDQAQQDQFDRQPIVWDHVAGSPEEGGHAIVGGGHVDPAGGKGADVKAACWEQEFGCTDEFLAEQLDEAWFVLFDWEETKQFISAEGLAAFASAFTAITGRPFPLAVTPTPEPTPTPGPTPAPPSPPTPAPSPVVVDAADLTLWNKVAKAFIQHKHYSGAVKDLVAGIETWAEDKGFLPKSRAPHVPEHEA